MRSPALIVAVILMLVCFTGNAQDSDTALLEEVVVKAYGRTTSLNTAAAINLINNAVIERYAGVSLINAINSLPGVVMEERSPGSYRFNIRGSSLRSPFGVRNVKVYYNDIPFTEPGGTTYLNALGVYNFHSAEIIKGPGSSMYGAGTGGVILIEGTDSTSSNLASAAYTYGSYHLHQAYAGLNLAGHFLSYQHLQSDGYRIHSALKKDVFSYTGTLLRHPKHQIRLSLLYATLYYQTPGGLTRDEFLADPRRSRPAAGMFPSAIAAKAAIHQENLLAGISYRCDVNADISQHSVLYFAYNTLKNPAIRNYGKNTEPHFGGRTQWRLFKKRNEISYTIDGGIEFQQNLNHIKVFSNNSGTPGVLQTDDRVHTKQYFIFLQGQLMWRRWTATAGISINQMEVKFHPVYPPGGIRQTAVFSNGAAPRISLLRKFNRMSVYAAIEKGFSPPSSSELLPSGSPLNLSLRAEKGWNRQLGIRGNIFRHLYADVNFFRFSLNNTIVLRRDAGGGDYFINGGATRQHGIETYISQRLFNRSTSINKAMLWFSHTWHSFRYRDFKQLNNDYSGNRLPGSPPHVLSAGLDLLMQKVFSANATWYYSDRIFLNDANNVSAGPYHLLGLKLGYKFHFTRLVLQLSAGADNLLNETYSNGNDINTAGGRYYNTAAGRNYYVQLSMDIERRK